MGLEIVAEMIANIGIAAHGAAKDLRDATAEAETYQATVAGMSGGGSSGGIGATTGGGAAGGGMTPAALAGAINKISGRQ